MCYMGTYLPPPKKKGAAPLTFRPMHCGETAGRINTPHGTEVDLTENMAGNLYDSIYRLLVLYNLLKYIKLKIWPIKSKPLPVEVPRF